MNVEYQTEEEENKEEMEEEEVEEEVEKEEVEEEVEEVEEEEEEEKLCHLQLSKSRTGPNPDHLIAVFQCFHKVLHCLQTHTTKPQTASPPNNGGSYLRFPGTVTGEFVQI